jgi:hypothetical protein
MSLLKINLNTSRISKAALISLGVSHNIIIDQLPSSIVFIDDNRSTHDWIDINAEVMAIHPDITTEVI